MLQLVLTMLCCIVCPVTLILLSARWLTLYDAWCEGVSHQCWSRLKTKGISLCHLSSSLMTNMPTMSLQDEVRV
jgi:hypothetical protein